MSHSGRYVAVSGYDDGRVLVYDTAGRERLPELATVQSTSPGVVAPPPVGPSAQLEAVRDYAEGRSREPAWPGSPRLADPRLNTSGVVNTAEQRYTAALAFAPTTGWSSVRKWASCGSIDPGTGRELRVWPERRG